MRTPWLDCSAPVRCGTVASAKSRVPPVSASTISARRSDARSGEVPGGRLAGGLGTGGEHSGVHLHPARDSEDGYPRVFGGGAAEDSGDIAGGAVAPREQHQPGAAADHRGHRPPGVGGRRRPGTGIGHELHRPTVRRSAIGEQVRTHRAGRGQHGQGRHQLPEAGERAGRPGRCHRFGPGIERVGQGRAVGTVQSDPTAHAGDRVDHDPHRAGHGHQSPVTAGGSAALRRRRGPAGWSQPSGRSRPRSPRTAARTRPCPRRAAPG